MDWWSRHFARTCLVDVELADTIPGGCLDWAKFERIKPEAGLQRFDNELPAVEADRGEYLGFVRVIASRRS